ncbi:agmatinase [Pseudomaricurvus alkylphenolicus]|jgi:agmatinase|uniref:agmatinase n=1 Tax=Pseudomaricurvus alkylphenolicus TaxID=1306991 RepID=UPI00141DAEC0|nr:agmatinase [Pseudomaricurvus alkylphenolicus]NIB39939.1 agmatinase [Pseudomaricurvus alkylphenolicus]
MSRPTDFAITREDLKGSDVEPTYAGVLSFMRRKYSRDLEGVDVAVTGVPFDLAVSNRSGARMGPRALRAASSNLAWGTVAHWGFDPFEELAVVDYGDCGFDSSCPSEVPEVIESHIANIIEQGPATLMLGGDHFVTYPALKAYAKKHGPISLIHFDAHYDTWNDSKGTIDHGTMFYHAAKQGIVDPSRSIQIGMRTAIDDTIGFKVLDAHWVHQNGVDAVVEAIRERVGDHPTYLTFDIDCLDPSFAPGTGTPVIGGLSSYQAQRILRGLEGINLVGMDQVEVAPAYDHAEMTALAGASLALDMLCLFARRPR